MTQDQRNIPIKDRQPTDDYLPASGRYASTREAEEQRRANCRDNIDNEDS